MENVDASQRGILPLLRHSCAAFSGCYVDRDPSTIFAAKSALNWNVSTRCRARQQVVVKKTGSSDEVQCRRSIFSDAMMLTERECAATPR
jgi:hypothetical protein